MYASVNWSLSPHPGIYSVIATSSDAGWRPPAVSLKVRRCNPRGDLKGANVRPTAIGWTGVCLTLLSACAQSSGGVAQGPAAVVRGLYTLPDPDFGAFHDAARRGAYYTPRIVALIAAGEACYRREYGMDHLDFDYIVPGQDYDVRNLDIALLERSDADARVLVTFDNFDEHVTLEYRLEQIGGRWLIADTLVREVGADTLFEALRNAC